MFLLTLTLVLATEEPADTLGKRMFPVYLNEAKAYNMAVEPAPTKEMDLRQEPVFEWSNPTRTGVQHGVVFLWLRDGRPAAVGCLFSYPDFKLPGRRVVHEMHALDAEKLKVQRPGEFNQWEPKSGLARATIPGAAAPAPTATARLIQMRRLAQRFTGHTIDKQDTRLELRLLPSPLYRYPSAEEGVVDGALFALVSEAGTDPEVLLLIEARDDGGKRSWQYACGRFSDRNLHIFRDGEEVWSSIRSETNVHFHDEQHLYRFFGDKIVTEEGKLLARVRPSDKYWYGEIIPVEGE